MKSQKIVFVLVVLVLVSIGVFVQFSNKDTADHKAQSVAAKYVCPMHPQVISDKPGDCPICHMRLVPSTVEEAVPSQKKNKILFYRNPMTPTITSPVPMKDSMGMDYIPVYEEQTPITANDSNENCLYHDCPMMKEGKSCPMLVVAQNGEKLECPLCKEKINTQSLKAKDLIPVGYASILVSPQKQQLIGVKTSVVTRRNLPSVVHATGKVAYDQALYDAQVEYIREAKLKIANDRYPVPKPKVWGTTPVEKAKNNLLLMGLNEVMITDLLKTGVADQRLLNPGKSGEVWVYVNIYESDLAHVNVGDMLEIHSPVAPTVKFSAPIVAISSRVDSQTRTVLARALVKNESQILKQDMFVDVAVVSGGIQALWIPEESVLFTGKANIVFVDKGNGIFEPRKVILGQKTEGFYEVKDGLTDQEKIVTSGNFLFDSESRIKAAFIQAVSNSEDRGNSHD